MRQIGADQFEERFQVGDGEKALARVLSREVIRHADDRHARFIPGAESRDLQRHHLPDCHIVLLDDAAVEDDSGPVARQFIEQIRLACPASNRHGSV